MRTRAKDVFDIKKGILYNAINETRSNTTRNPVRIAEFCVIVQLGPERLFDE